MALSDLWFVRDPRKVQAHTEPLRPVPETRGETLAPEVIAPGLVRTGRQNERLEWDRNGIRLYDRNGNLSLGLGRGSYATVEANGGGPVESRLGGIIDLGEIVDVDGITADHGVIFARDNGAGKTQLCAKFPTGALQVLATEP